MNGTQIHKSFKYQISKYYETIDSEQKFVFKLLIDAIVEISPNNSWIHLEYKLVPIIGDNHVYTYWEKNSRISDWELRGGENLSFHNSIMIKDSTFRSLGCGSLLMNEMLTQAKQYMPSSSICIKLSYVDCKDQTNRIRRNNFYKKFNFSLKFDDERECTGSGKLQLKDVILYSIEDLGFREVNIEDYLESLAQDNLLFLKENKELQNEIKGKKSFIKFQSDSMQKDIKKLIFWRRILVVIILIILLF
jgi:GNAT superfamily N-acetyltransferase